MIGDIFRDLFLLLAGINIGVIIMYFIVKNNPGMVPTIAADVSAVETKVGTTIGAVASQVKKI
jgi:hypothetical protein